MNKRLLALLSVLVLASMVLAACGAPATEAPVVVDPTATEAPVVIEPTVAPTEDPMAMYAPDAVTGDIITAGSSTVFPLSERMAELFQNEGYTGNLSKVLSVPKGVYSLGPHPT